MQQQQQQTVQLVSGSALSPQPQSGTTQQVITLTPEQYAQLAQQQQQPGVLYLLYDKSYNTYRSKYLFVGCRYPGLTFYS